MLMCLFIVLHRLENCKVCDRMAQCVSVVHDFCGTNRQRLTADGNAETCVAVGDSGCYCQVSTERAKWRHNVVTFTDVKFYENSFGGGRTDGHGQIWRG
jgi:hypothetical protein